MAQEIVGLIGDVVGSRTAPDRAGLQQRLTDLLAEVSLRTEGHLVMTVGDEFQGRYPDVESALMASLRLHLGVIGLARLRIGIGRGSVVFEGEPTSPFGQDGPVWWRARDAVDTVAGGGDVAWTLVNTTTSWDGLINAYLAMRDTVLAGFDDVDAVICRGLLDGITQKALAGELGLNQSSVSRRVNQHGVARLVAAAANLELELEGAQ